jgi:SAM-dependent methyltransferase
MKHLIKPLVPQAALRFWRATKAARLDARFADKSPAEVFSTIYKDGLWYGDDPRDLNSGTGSREERIVQPYIEALRTFCNALPVRPDVVDLGCGDFNVGARLRDAAQAFVACDVVPAIIERNRQLFAELEVDFRCVDIVSESLPKGQVAFLRQVLQHLSNVQVSAVVRKLPSTYEWVVVTEHLPKSVNFRPNIDKPTGPGTRLRLGSGIVVTEAPFALLTREQHSLCSIEDDSGVIRTTAYRL